MVYDFLPDENSRFDNMTRGAGLACDDNTNSLSARLLATIPLEQEYSCKTGKRRMLFREGFYPALGMLYFCSSA